MRIFCVCSEFIFIIAHKRASRRAENNIGLIKIDGLSQPPLRTLLLLTPLSPPPWLLWPTRRSKQVGLLAYNPNSISSKYPAWAGTQVKFSFCQSLHSQKSTRGWTIWKIYSAFMAFFQDGSIHPHRDQKIWLPSPNQSRNLINPFWIRLFNKIWYYSNQEEAGRKQANKNQISQVGHCCAHIRLCESNHQSYTGLGNSNICMYIPGFSFCKTIQTIYFPGKYMESIDWNYLFYITTE